MVFHRQSQLNRKFLYPHHYVLRRNLISSLLFWSAFGNVALFHLILPATATESCGRSHDITRSRLTTQHAKCRPWGAILSQVLITPTHNHNIISNGAVSSIPTTKLHQMAIASQDSDEINPQILTNMTAPANKSIRRTVRSMRMRQMIPSWIRIYYKRAIKNHNHQHQQATKDPNEPSRERGMTGSFRDWSHSKQGIKFVIAYVVGYLALSVGAFSGLLEPSWTIIDSLYFAVATFTTVGYGDLSPTTMAGKVFTIFFSLYGISILGIALGIIGTNVAEAQETALKGVRIRASKRLLKLFDNFSDGEKNPSDARVDQRTQQSEQESITSASSALTTSYLESLSTNDVSNKNLKDTNSTASKHDREEEIPITKQICSILLSQLPILSSILTIAVFLGKRYEGWSTFTSIYYCWITLTTVGYGDFTPKSQQMRLFAVFFLPLWVAVDGEIISRIAEVFVDREEDRLEHQFLARELTMHDLLVMDTHKTGDVSFDEFLSYMLVAMHKVDQETIDELRDVFNERDLNGSGSIMREDLVLMARKRKEYLQSKSYL